MAASSSALMTSSSTSTSAVKKASKEEIAKNIAESKLMVSVSRDKHTEVVSVSSLIEAAKKANRAIIFFITPGPFKKDLPPHWGDDPRRLGCTLNVNKCEADLLELDADIFAINHHSAEYQAGTANEEGLVKRKGLTNVRMISGNNGELQEKWKLRTLPIENDNEKYLDRLTVVIMPNGAIHAFDDLVGPLNDAKMNLHIAAIKSIIAPVQNNTPSANTPAAPAKK